MRIHLALLGSAIALCGAALAAGTDNLQVTATINQSCEIVTSTPSIDLSNVPANTWSPYADFTYRCNFGGTPALTFASLKGGIENASIPGLKADYGIYLNDFDNGQSPSASLRASAATGAGVTFASISNSSPANSIRAPKFKVGLIQPLTIAGSYSDTLTISIAP